MATDTSIRRTGSKMRVTVGGVNIAEGTDCVVKITPNILKSRAWSDEGTVTQPDGYEWEVTAKKFARTANLGDFLGLPGANITAGAPARLVVYNLQGVTETRVFEGDMWAGEAIMNLPMGGYVEENVTFVGTGDVVYA